MTTYATLVADVKDYMEDDGTEFSDAVDGFIDVAELKLSRDLAVPAFRKRQTSALTQSDPFLTLPTDLITLEYLQTVSSNVRSNLLLKSDEFMQEYWPNRTSTGTPKYYGYFDNSTIYVAPTPSANTSVEISYRRRLPALSSSATSNWLSTDAYDALLYACLIEASTYNRNDKTLGYYTQLYQKAVQDVNKEGVNRRSYDNFYMKTEG
jgi:hypothetical protein